MTDLYVVRESFTMEVNGVPTAYRKGEVVDPSDPIIRTHRSQLEPFQYPHPVAARSKPVEQATAAPGEKRGK